MAGRVGVTERWARVVVVVEEAEEEVEEKDSMSVTKKMKVVCRERGAVFLAGGGAGEMGRLGGVGRLLP